VRQEGSTAYRRVLVAVLAVALLACAYVAAVRYRYEHRSRQVEIALDYLDFSALSQAYGYDPLRFLRALRAAGLTSLAVQEQFGSDINNSRGAASYTGQSLIDQARLSALRDPFLNALVRSRRLRPSAIYLIVYDPAEFARYRDQSIIHFGSRNVRVLRIGPPSVIEIRTQADFFNGTGFGFPESTLALARSAGLWLVPRVQNDETFGPAQIHGIVDGFMRYGHVSTVIFFGTRLQVLGYPNHIASTAAALGRAGVNYGSVEYYTPAQDMKGNEELARLIPGLTTRVLAIPRPELDQLDPQAIIARYLLGVRERNIRVIYLRPILHVWGERSLFESNVELVRRLATELRASGFTLGRASPIPAFRIRPTIIAIASLAVPAAFLLLLDLLGIASPSWAVALFVLDLALFAVAAHFKHEMIARKLVALGGALLFPVIGAVAIGPAFAMSRPQPLGKTLRSGVELLAIAVAITLGGALVVVGLLSTPLTMEEIDRFTGVKLVLVVPPLVILGFALAGARFGATPGGWRAALASPVRIYQLGLGVVLLVGAFFLIVRSGNESDVAPSAFELALRSSLTTLLTVRPRFKEFALAWPLLMLLPALWPGDLRRFGWLIALCVGIGLADVVDTFSHLHTALAISILRLINGLVLGIILGAIVVIVYRRFRPLE
jgi:hypothetical protein